MDRETHISSIIINATPSYIEAIKLALNDIPSIETVTSDKQKGKIVVIIEASSTTLISDSIEQIKMWDGVMSVSLIYHHTEDSQFLEEDIL